MSDLLLGVNIDHVATLRNARGLTWPDPVQAAFIVEQAGADGITVHLREDRRHITDRDVFLLRKMIHTRMNLEIAPTEEMVNLACSVSPHFCCLVPERREELTTEGGLNITKQCDKIRQIIVQLHNSGIRVSLFVDPSKEQIAAAATIGATYIEIHTGAYANSINETSRIIELARISEAAQYAKTFGIKVNAGHGLDYHNVKPIAALLPIQELNIGYAIISRSIISGLSESVKYMKALMCEARS